MLKPLTNVTFCVADVIAIVADGIATFTFIFIFMTDVIATCPSGRC